MELQKQKIEQIESVNEREHELFIDQIDEVFENSPKWLIHYGLNSILILFGLALLFSWFIKYPDKVSSPIIISSEVKPIAYNTHNFGLIQIIVQEGQTVKENQPLAIFNQSANTNDILWLRENIEGLTQPRLDVELGELQTLYLNYVRVLDEYNQFQNLGSYNSQIEKSTIQVLQYEHSIENLKKQLAIQKEELSLTAESFTGDSILYSKSLISKQEFSNGKARYLAGKRELKSTTAGLNNLLILKISTENSIGILKAEQAETEQLLTSDVRLQLNILKEGLRHWEERNIVTSVSPGIVHYSGFWKPTQYINNNVELFMVFPEEQNIVGTLQLPMQNSGKVKVGQPVLIDLHAYPSLDFGRLEGIVERISTLPAEGKYLVQVSLPQGLISSYHNELSYKPDLTGNAEVITEDLRLINRVFNQLQNLVR